MNTAHIHLLVTHLPIIGSLIGFLILLFAAIKKDNNVKIAAYLVFILCAIGAAIAYATGEGAEEVVEKLPGVLESAIETHEDAAMFSLIAMIALGLTAIAGIFQISYQWIKFKFIHNLILIIALISMISIAYTGNLGGKIRHTEIADASTLQNTNEQPSNEGDDD
ncbi:MAG: hypothetical protein RI952_624 [Bacteroidota bacterium]|jgi:uncharacterized membrane protein